MSSSLSVFVGTFLKLPDCIVEKIYKVNICRICNTVLESPYCPKCGSKSDPVIRHKAEPLDFYQFCEDNDIDEDTFCSYEDEDDTIYIITNSNNAGKWVDPNNSMCLSTPISTENCLVPYMDIMRALTDKCVPFEIIQGVFTAWS